MGCLIDLHLVIIISIMICAGGFGGLLNYLHNFDTNKDDPKNSVTVIKYVLLGIGAAILVPAFLKMISSSLLSSSDNNDLLIFAGFCLIAAIFSKRFINTIGEKILEAAKKAEKNSEENKQQILTTQRELNTTQERIEDVKLAVDIKNTEGNITGYNNSEQEKLLIKLADTYIEKTSIPDYFKRLQLKAEIGRRMGEIIVRNNLSKIDLLKNNPSEGMYMALAYSIQLKPSNDGLVILNKVSKKPIQLYTKFSILVSYDTLARNGFINKLQLKEIITLIQGFRYKADEPLLKKIDHSISLLSIIDNDA